MAGHYCLFDLSDPMAVNRFRTVKYLFFIYGNGINHYKSLRGYAATL